MENSLSSDAESGIIDPELRAKLEVAMDTLVPCAAIVHNRFGEKTSYIDDDPESLANFCISLVDSWLCREALKLVNMPKEPLSDRKIIDGLPDKYRLMALEELSEFESNKSLVHRQNELYYLALKSIVENDGTIAFYIVQNFNTNNRDNWVAFKHMPPVGDNLEEVDPGVYKDMYYKLKQVYEPNLKQD